MSRSVLLSQLESQGTTQRFRGGHSLVSQQPILGVLGVTEGTSLGEQDSYSQESSQEL